MSGDFKSPKSTIRMCMWNYKDLYHSITCYGVTLQVQPNISARSGRILGVFQLFIRRIRYSYEFIKCDSQIIIGMRCLRSKWSETLLRYYIFMPYKKPQILQAVHRMNLVSWDTDGFWLYRNIQDLMPQPLSQVRRTQRNDILCKGPICASQSSSSHHLPEQSCQHDFMHHWWGHNFSYILTLSLVMLSLKMN